MYSIEFPAITTSAGWNQVIQLIDDATNLPFVGLDAYRFIMTLKDDVGTTLLTADTDNGTATINAASAEVSWSFTKDQLPNQSTPQIFKIGAILESPTSGREQLFVGSISFIDGIVQ